MEAPTGLRRVFDSRDGEREIDVRLFSDEPIHHSDLDYFGFASFAAALAEIIDNEGTGTPLTIALSAPWGAGKTSVARMIERDLRERVADRRGARQRIVCRFNAWEHTDAPHLGAALAARVARVANGHRPRWRRLWEPLPSAMLEPRERWARVFWLAAVAAVVTSLLLVFPPTRELADRFFDPREAAVGAFGVLWLATIVWGALYKAGRNATRFVDDPGSEAARGSIAEVKKQLGRLISQATGGGRMVIFVDDLERCRAVRAVEVFEVAGLLLAHEGVVTVLLADMRSLADAAKVAYKEESGEDDPELGRRYMEKLVQLQLQLQLPPPDPSDMRLLLGGERPAIKGRKEERDDDGGEVSAVAEDYSTWMSSAWAWGFIAMLPALVAALAQGSDIGDATTVAIVVGGTVTVIVGVLAAVTAIWERARRQRVAERVKTTLRENRDAIPVDDAEHESLARKAAGEEKYESLAIQVAESLRTVESPEIEAVEAVIKSYPPRFPRGAKRMVNHARLLTKIARERDMFGGDPELTPAHLGKWIVISERWPSFAEQIARNPATIRDVENPGALDMPNPHLPVDESGEFSSLIKEDPKLSEVVERLIHFKLATDDPPSVVS